ncbi:hypothetical protein [Streptomyces sp. NPDC005525]|uniref:hypothetical protein n=1 Tax=Streptomyces sp. NPDC005525 TaxID=3364720 RepID=UPI0036A9699D
MTATATIDEVVCLRPATSTDFDLDAVVKTLLEPVFALPGGGVLEKLADIAQVEQMISDAVTEQPDDLYITATASAGLENAIWPSGDPVQAAARDRIEVGRTVSVEGTQDIFLFDKDEGGVFGSPDDVLGSVTISEDERGMGSLSKLAHSEEEHSFYYVNYHVD